MKCAFIILGIATATCFSTLPESGFYNVEDMLVRYAPAAKQNGSTWDPLNGLPDIFLEFSMDDGDYDWVIHTNGVKENSGTSASWSHSWEICFEDPSQESSDIHLMVKIWDSDSFQSDFMDSGSIPLSSLVVGENEIQCNYGSHVTFTITGPHNEGRIHP